jgi:hypothetical protein
MSTCAIPRRAAHLSPGRVAHNDPGGIVPALPHESGSTRIAICEPTVD